MQGALASHCYDFFAPVRTVSIDNGTRNLFAEYPNPYPSGHPYLDGVKGASRFCNFHNFRDFALDLWKANQDLKPGSAVDGDYQWTQSHDYFVGTAGGWGGQFSDIVTRQLYSVPDRYEIFSGAAEARCWAIGAQPGLAGAFQGNEVDLQAEFGFNDPASHHSGQFNSAIQVRLPVWKRLLVKFVLFD